MEHIFETDNVILEYFPEKSEGQYRLSLFDRYGHFEDEFDLDARHVRDLIECFKNNDFELDENEDFL